MNKIQIDPRTQMFIMILVGIITFLGANSLPPDVSPSVAKEVRDWSIYIGQFYNVVVGPLLLAFTNSNPGPLAPPDPPSVIAAHAKEDAKP